MLIELFFASSHAWRYERIFVEIVLFESGAGHVERKGGRGVVHQQCLASIRKLESLGYHVVLYA